MTDQNQKKQDERNSVIKPVVAVVTGAIVGAGVVAAGAVALKDKKNREKVKKMLTAVKDQAKGFMENIQKGAQDKKGKIEKKPGEGQKK